MRWERISRTTQFSSKKCICQCMRPKTPVERSYFKQEKKNFLKLWVVPENILVVAGTIGKALHFKGIVWTPIQSTQRTIIGEHSSQERKKCSEKRNSATANYLFWKALSEKVVNRCAPTVAYQAGKTFWSPTKVNILQSAITSPLA